MLIIEYSIKSNYNIFLLFLNLSFNPVVFSMNLYKPLYLIRVIQTFTPTFIVRLGVESLYQLNIKELAINSVLNYISKFKLKGGLK